MREAIWCSFMHEIYISFYHLRYVFSAYMLGTFGTMGVGLGFAIASQLYCQKYHPDKRVICVEGDSAFGFSGMEIETMYR